MENDLSAALETISIRNYVKSVKESDPGIAHERGAIMKLYAMQAKYSPIPKSKPDYMKRLLAGQVSQLEMKPGGKMTDFYSNKKSSTLDDKFSKSVYGISNKSSPGYKLRPIKISYQLPIDKPSYSNNLEYGEMEY